MRYSLMHSYCPDTYALCTYSNYQSSSLHSMYVHTYLCLISVTQQKQTSPKHPSPLPSALAPKLPYSQPHPMSSLLRETSICDPQQVLAPHGQLGGVGSERSVCPQAAASVANRVGVLARNSTGGLTNGSRCL